MIEKLLRTTIFSPPISSRVAISERHQGPQFFLSQQQLIESPSNKKEFCFVPTSEDSYSIMWLNIKVLTKAGTKCPSIARAQAAYLRPAALAC